MISEVTAGHEIDDKVQIVSVFKRIMHIDEERMCKLTEKLLLIHDRVDATL